MKTKVVLILLKYGAMIAYYFLLVITVIIAGSYVYKIFNEKQDRYLDVDKTGKLFITPDAAGNASYVYSADQVVRYKPKINLYTLGIRLNSPAGYYYMASTLVFLSLGLVILWNFKQVFSAIELNSPFKASVVKRLYLLALVFIVSDLLGFVHYFILHSFINHAVHQPRLQMISERGDGILIGLIMLVIAVVYKRGLEIYEENSLTV